MSQESRKQKTVGVALSYAVVAAELLSGLLYTPLVLRLLGQSHYGIYSLVMSFSGYLTIFNAGANAAYIRFYVQTKETDKEKVDGLNGLFLLLFTVLAALGTTAGLVIARFSPQLLGTKILPQEYALVSKGFTILSVMIGISVFNSCFSSFVIANERFIFGKALNCLSVVILPFISVPLLLTGHDCAAVIAVKAAIAAATLLANILFCFRVLHIKYKLERYSRELLHAIFWFMGVILLNSVTDQLNWQIDKLILARTQGTAQISIYSVGATFNSIYIQLGMAVSGVFIAQVNQLVSRNERRELDDLFIRTSRLNMYITCLVMSGFTFFGKAFIIRWAGVEYADSFLVSWLLMFPLTVTMTLGLQLEIGRATNLHHIQIKINTVLCILNTLVSIPLAVRWGALGSALGTFLTEALICFIVQPIYIWKVLKMDIRRTFLELAKILPAFVIPVTTGALFNLLGLVKPDYVSVFSLAAVYTVIYAASVWCIAMNGEEKIMIQKMILRKQAR